jgi:DNA-binding CsgD family transcriptional regulator
MDPAAGKPPQPSPNADMPEKKMSLLEQQAAMREVKLAELKARGLSKEEILKELKIRPRRVLRKNHA